MRATLHLDTFDSINAVSYAILWLDAELLKWSREAHAGMTLPEWGTLRSDGRNTYIYGSFGTRPACVLEGLELGKSGSPFEGESGRALGYPKGSTNPKAGHWHVQCVDNEHLSPEFSIFADYQPTGTAHLTRPE